MKFFFYSLIGFFESFVNYVFHLFRTKKYYKRIIIKTDNLGDNVLLIKSLKKLRLDNILIITTIESQTLYLKLLPSVDIIKINREKVRLNFLYRLKVLFILSKFKSDQLVTPIFLTDWLSAGSLMNYISANEKVQIGRKIKLLKPSYLNFSIKNHKIVHVKQLNEFLAIDEFFQKLKWEKIKEKATPCYQTKPDTKDSHVLIFPYTTDNFRNITKKQVEFITRFLNKLDIFPQIMGIAKKPYQLSTSLGYIDMTNTTSLSDVIDEIKNASLVICAETGPYHIAQFYNIKTLLIAGGGHFGRFFNNEKVSNNYVVFSNDKSCFGCNWQCTRFVHSYYPCLENITENQIDIGLKIVMGSFDV